MAAPRVTELANPVTMEIDVAPPEALIRTLACSDAQMFTGYLGLPCVYDDVHVLNAVRLVKAMSAALLHPKGRVVFSGCGTSGRLSHLEARGFNKAVQASGLAGRFDYLIAGGDAALLLPQEAAEDKPDAPVSDLKSWEVSTGTSPDAPVVVVGISCGLSATYVGALLEAVLEPGARPGWTAVAVGFNPAQSISHVKVAAWSNTFYNILQRIEKGSDGEPGRSIILNPITGPESIAGSSRMKGGSMTKILLETASACAIRLAQLTAAASGAAGAAAAPTLPTDADLADWIRDGYLGYERAIRLLYAQNVPRLSSLVTRAGETLTTPVDPHAQLARASGTAGFSSPTGRGRVVYLGAGTAGALCLIDASECTPTYGSLFNDVRGFISGGWTAMYIHQKDITGLTVPKHVRGDGAVEGSSGRVETVGIDLASFERDVLPYLGPADLVLAVVLNCNDDVSASDMAAVTDGLGKAKAQGCVTSFVTVTSSAPTAGEAAAVAGLEGASTQAGVAVSIPVTAIQPGSTALLKGSAGPSIGPVSPMPSTYAELVLKLCLNSITTGAHIKRGTIYTNRMVNVMLTNVKLFYRAVGIVADVVKCGTEVALEAVVRAIYSVDRPDAGQPTTTTDKHGRTLEQLLQVPVAEHVAAAASTLGLVPLSILLAADAARSHGLEIVAAAHGPSIKLSRPYLTVAEARAALAKEPVIRKAVAACLTDSTA